MSLSYTRLKGVTSVGQPLVSRQIKDNILSFFNWGFVNMGGFQTVLLGTSGTYGGDKSVFRLVQDPRYTAGRVWESFTNEFVWESGIQDFATQPVRISGVWVNNVFLPNSGAQSFYVNYRDGQIIFANPIPTGSRVQCEYSYRFTRFVDAETPWLRDIMTNADRIDNTQFNTPGSGNYNILSQAKVVLPAVGVKIQPRFAFDGMQLGGGNYLHQDVTFNILTEDENTRNQIMDIIRYQYYSTLIMYDTNTTPKPLNYNGSLASGVKTYADLVTQTASGTAYKKLFFEDMAGLDLGSVNQRIYAGIVRTTCFVNLDEI